MNTIIRFGRRQLHTIVSSEIIKPSVPTPSHLKVYNLSACDQYMPNAYIPWVTFYPNIGIHHSSSDQMLELKSSLSRLLTKYYPFAGRHSKISPTYVDCNDHGVEFLEASVDGTLSNLLQNSQLEEIDQFFPYGRIWKRIAQDHDLQGDDSVIPLSVKVSHFECGGVALAVSLSHKIADALSSIQFLSDWAKMTSKTQKYDQLADPIEPHFMSFDKTNLKLPISLPDVSNNDCVTRSFMFTNSKINELKRKVIAMAAGSGQNITNPTRFEVLTWLFYKCAVAATAATRSNSGFFKPRSIQLPINVRRTMIEPLPENSIGNFVTVMVVQTTNEKEMRPEWFISEMRKQKLQLKGLKNIETVFRPLLNMSLDLKKHQGKYEDKYLCSSVCRYHVYGIDFGWGTPIKATMAGNLRKNSFVMMDAPNEEGVEVLVCLEKQDMDIIQTDPHLLAFC